jgi:hypothetical protein
MRNRRNTPWMSQTEQALFSTAIRDYVDESNRMNEQR